MANWAKYREDEVGLPVVKRAKHAIHFKRPDGKIQAEFSLAPCHYLDTDGIWKAIDTALIPLGDGFYGCPHSKVRVHPDGRVGLTSSNYVQRVELPDAPTGIVVGDKLVRAFSFGEQRMWVTEDGFRSEIQLNRVPTLAEAKKLITTESGTLPLEYLKSLTTATDASGNVHTYSTLSAFRTWLASAVYPVVIDPDFTSGVNDGYVYGRDATYSTAHSTVYGFTYNNTPTINIGQDKDALSRYLCYRGLLLFDTSSIDDTATVTQVNLRLVVTTDASSVDFDVVIKKLSWSDLNGTPTNGTYQENAYDGCLTADSDDSIWRNTNGISKNTQYTSGNLSATWVSKTGTTYYALISSRDVSESVPTSGEYIVIASGTNTTTSYRPTLIVTVGSSPDALTSKDISSGVPNVDKPTLASVASGVPKQFMHYQRLRSL